MPDATYLTTQEANDLADKLSEVGAARSVATRIAMVESQCRLAARLIRAMLSQVHQSDVFRLPPEEE